MNKFGAFIEQFLICQTPADGIDILSPDSWRRLDASVETINTLTA